MIITRQMYLKGREKKFAQEFTDDLSNNTNKTIARASELLSRAGITKAYVTSGWRPKSVNSSVGGALNSLHIYCLAIDIFDKDKQFGQWCVTNLEALAEIGLWMESLTRTHSGDEPWVHLQCLPPKSNNRVFLP